ncbi:hypothetical protein HDU76_009371, partial [Blyttiomyces sp. JEL0837]
DEQMIGSYSSDEVILSDAVTGQIIKYSSKHNGVKALSPCLREVAIQNHGNINIFDIMSDFMIKQLKHDVFVSVISYSPSGLNIAGGYWSGENKVWDISKGEPVRTFDKNSISLQFSNDEKYLVSSCYGEIMNIETQQQIKLPVNNPEKVCAISPDGTMAVSGDGETALISVLDLTSKLSSDPTIGHIGFVKLSPDGLQAASFRPYGTPGDTIVIWDVQKNKALRFFNTKYKVSSFSFSENGEKLIAGGEDGSITMWEVSGKGSEEKILPRHRET